MPASATPPDGAAAATPALADSLRDMEPALPAPADALLDPETLADELELADAADGMLPRHLREQPEPKSAARLAAEEADARDARGVAALVKQDAGGVLSDAEHADVCYHLDPISNERPPARRRQGT